MAAGKRGKTPQQYGKEFEGRIQSLLTAMQQKHRLRLTRLYDTSSTGVISRIQQLSSGQV